MFMYDRLYGRLQFPAIINKILDCPGLLRLRDVRMANIPFFSFPSFTAVNRYEHSLGVCHLAGIFSNFINLAEKDKIELMLAALYHDVATPPFAHAMENILHDYYGFNHEYKLKQLIIGKTADIGGQRSQIYLGKMLKIHKICQSIEGRKLGLDLYRIADIATGDVDEPLSGLICSNDIDLDNIDNVVRASSAMGVRDCDLRLPELLAKSLLFHESKLVISESNIALIRKWQRLRTILYGMIFSSIRDFSIQTMYKDAIKQLCESDSKYKIDESDWSLTDNQLIHDKLLKYKPSAKILNDISLGKLYTCLAVFIVEDFDLKKKLSDTIQLSSDIASNLYIEYLNSYYKPIHKKYNNERIIVDFYYDKRVRNISKELIFFDMKKRLSDDKVIPKAIVGIFTPFHLNWNNEVKMDFLKSIKKNINLESIKMLKIEFDEYPDVIGVEI